MNVIFIYKILDFIDKNCKNAKKHVVYVYKVFFF